MPAIPFIISEEGAASGGGGERGALRPGEQPPGPPSPWGQVRPHNQSPGEMLTVRLRSQGRRQHPAAPFLSWEGDGAERGGEEVYRHITTRDKKPTGDDRKSFATDSDVRASRPPVPASRRHFLFRGLGGAAAGRACCERRHEKPPDCSLRAALSSPGQLREGTQGGESLAFRARKTTGKLAFSLPA